MLINKTGEGCYVHGQMLNIGDYIHISKDADSLYANLYGTVTEIRTDKDAKEVSDMEGPILICDLQHPVLPADVTALTKRFSAAYQKKVEIEDIALNEVVVSFYDLEYPWPPVSSFPLTLYKVICDWDNGCDSHKEEKLFCDKRSALRNFNHLFVQKGVVVPKEAYEKPFCVNGREYEFGEFSYRECGYSGCFVQDHLCIRMEEVTLETTQEFISDICQRQEALDIRQDVESFLDNNMPMDDIELTDDEITEILNDPDLAVNIKEKTESHPSYSNVAYYDTIEDVVTKKAKRLVADRKPITVRSFECEPNLAQYTDSMLYPSEHTIAHMAGEVYDTRFDIYLSTRGSVSVEFQGKVYTNPSKFPEELKERIRTRPYEWENDEDVCVKDNNWFEYIIYCDSANEGIICEDVASQSADGIRAEMLNLARKFI